MDQAVTPYAKISPQTQWVKRISVIARMRGALQKIDVICAIYS
jgi:hypothetical protein